MDNSVTADGHKSIVGRVVVTLAQQDGIGRGAWRSGVCEGERKVSVELARACNKTEHTVNSHLAPCCLEHGRDDFVVDPLRAATEEQWSEDILLTSFAHMNSRALASVWVDDNT